MQTREDKPFEELVLSCIETMQVSGLFNQGVNL